MTHFKVKEERKSCTSILAILGLDLAIAVTGSTSISLTYGCDGNDFWHVSWHFCLCLRIAQL